jgi:predicted PurR-regulated permease PerM
MNASARSRVEFWFALIWGLFLRFALVAGVLYALYRVIDVIVTVVMAVFLAVAIAPIVDFFDRPRWLPFLSRGTRRFVITILVFLLLLGLLILCYGLIFRPLGEQLVQIVTNWPLYERVLAERLSTLRAQYDALPTDVRDFLEKQDFSRLTAGLAEKVQQIVSQTWRSTWLVVELILIPVLAYYFVVDSRSLKREFIVLVPRRRRREVLRLLGETTAVMKSYIIGQLLLALVAGLAVGLGLHWAGLNYPLAMGVVAAVTRVIPVVGPILGGIPIVLLAVAQSWQKGVWVLVFFSLLHLYESKILMPRVIGYRVKLHPAIIIIVLLIGAEFFGLMGMFLAAPIAAIIRILVNFYVITPRLRSERGGRRVGSHPPPSRGDGRSRLAEGPLPPSGRPPLADDRVEGPLPVEESPVERPAVTAPGSYSGSD